jgi:hypothetical protein
MSRGPLPQKGIELAMPVAQARGFVILCRHYYGYVCDLVIAEPGRTTIVRVYRAKRLYDTVAGMARQFRTGIAGLSRVPPDICRSLEIWVCDYYGNLRFFRVAGEGLIEILRTGLQLDPAAIVSCPDKEPSAGKIPSRPGRRKKTPVATVPPEPGGEGVPG